MGAGRAPRWVNTSSDRGGDAPNSTGQKLLCWDPPRPHPVCLFVRLFTWILDHIL